MKGDCSGIRVWYMFLSKEKGIIIIYFLFARHYEWSWKKDSRRSMLPWNTSLLQPLLKPLSGIMFVLLVISNSLLHDEITWALCQSTSFRFWNGVFLFKPTSRAFPSFCNVISIGILWFQYLSKRLEKDSQKIHVKGALHNECFLSSNQFVRIRYAKCVHRIIIKQM